ncbi:MAG: His/Gly/Thr/Pro-type tRNA ligase C-terminal domain-containing protein [bacterium]|nr:His/Gly/Thr/Pro-type tRNA ligase C-terminal domain-containing protein [bacterium]
MGVPYRITVGPRKLADGLVELTTRPDLETTEVTTAEVTERVAEMVSAALSTG